MPTETHLQLLRLIEAHPELSQRELADRLGISLGKTNYCLRSLKEKGWVKWGNFSANPNKAQYLHLLTPKGAAEKIALTLHFLRRKTAEYEELRTEIARLRDELDTAMVTTPALSGLAYPATHAAAHANP